MVGNRGHRCQPFPSSLMCVTLAAAPQLAHWPWGLPDKQINQTKATSQSRQNPLFSLHSTYICSRQRSSKRYCTYALCFVWKLILILQAKIGRLNLKPFFQFWMLQFIHFSRILQVLRGRFRNGFYLHPASPVFQHAFRSHEPGSPELENGSKRLFSKHTKCTIIYNAP